MGKLLMAKKIYYYDFLEFETKRFLVAATNRGLSFVSSLNKQFDEFYYFFPQQMMVQSSKIVAPYIKQLSEYLHGLRKEFTLNLDYEDFGTDLQNKIYSMVQRIPYGTTISSQNIALALCPSVSIREVEHAVQLNPILFVIPSHRVDFSFHKNSTRRVGLDMLEYVLALERSN